MSTRSQQDLDAAAEWADAARAKAEDLPEPDPCIDAQVSLAYSNLVIAGALGRIVELLDRQVNGA